MMFTLKKNLVSAIKNGKNLCRMQSKHTLPQLPYEYNALEPVLCCEMMQVHHMKHHQAYVNGLNDVEEKVKAAVEKNDFNSVMNLGNLLQFHGGGHLNHSMYWESLSPCGGQPSCELGAAITESFGSLDKMKDLMSQIAIGLQGSGWAWLGYNPVTCKLQLAKCKDQEPLFTTQGLIPLLPIDVWEHAYYIQYRNVRAEYVKNIWDVINWQKVSERFAQASKN
ncbi:hypothetical protein RUM44_008938 [Polyplax serrata]|uniref:Superoxide dismutase n=1 Tax=Polyplax serrata TaxID=468196 RepID=A0ABR1ARC2_POLSC